MKVSLVLNINFQLTPSILTKRTLYLIVKRKREDVGGESERMINIDREKKQRGR